MTRRQCRCSPPPAAVSAFVLVGSVQQTQLLSFSSHSLPLRVILLPFRPPPLPRAAAAGFSSTTAALVTTTTSPIVPVWAAVLLLQCCCSVASCVAPSRRALPLPGGPSSLLCVSDNLVRSFSVCSSSFCSSASAARRSSPAAAPQLLDSSRCRCGVLNSCCCGGCGCFALAREFVFAARVAAAATSLLPRQDDLLLQQLRATATGFSFACAAQPPSSAVCLRPPRAPAAAVRGHFPLTSFASLYCDAFLSPLLPLRREIAAAAAAHSAAAASSAAAVHSAAAAVSKMIDAVYAFTRGGVVLWNFCFVTVQGSPVENLIRNVLLEERSGSSSAAISPYVLQWHFLNSLEAVLVVVYRGVAQISFFDHLLQRTAAAFLLHIKQTSPLDYVRKGPAAGATFTPVFLQTFEEVFKKKTCRALQQPSAPRRGGAARGGKGGAAAAVLKKKQKQNSSSVDAAAAGEEEEERNEDADGGSSSTDAGGGEGGRAAAAAGAAGSSSSKSNSSSKKKKTSAKIKRPYWEDIASRVTQRSMTALDCSKKTTSEDVEKLRLAERSTYGADEAPGSSSDGSSLSDETSDGREGGSGGDGGAESLGQKSSASFTSQWLKRVTSKLQDITGNKLLTAEDIAETLPALRASLAAKNVAEEVSDLLLQSVRRKLTGTRTASFTSVQQTVKSALREAIIKILTPKKSVDVLRLALEAKAEGRVFSIVFLGVNGVGKSTNLAKVAYYLKHKGKLDVLIAACDTFRAGAVEQLRTHARCLDVPLFERGYGRDAAAIAREALAAARAERRDVVLIDTAGRMQDNEPLMRSLAKLVALNSPDLILFVGEALVGNDAVNQLKKFDQTLLDLTAGSTPGRAPRTVDGILLTKFDTVDDKVGAALSMVYVTGQPVVFVGTGQKYKNLKKLNPKTVVNVLLS